MLCPPSPRPRQSSLQPSRITSKASPASPELGVRSVLGVSVSDCASWPFWSPCSDSHVLFSYRGQSPGLFWSHNPSPSWYPRGAWHKPPDFSCILLLEKKACKPFPSQLCSLLLVTAGQLTAALLLIAHLGNHPQGCHPFRGNTTLVGATPSSVALGSHGCLSLLPPGFLSFFSPWCPSVLLLWQPLPLPIHSLHRGQSPSVSLS